MAECRDEGDVDDGMIARVKRQAIRLNRSVEGEHRELDRQDITNEEEPSFDELAADMRNVTKVRKQTPPKCCSVRDAPSGDHIRY